jgi:thiosulfate/3-mercaptopyruvate sulfurtransferase
MRPEEEEAPSSHEVFRQGWPEAEEGEGIKGRGALQRRQVCGHRAYRILLTALLGVCMGIALAQAETDGYARPELLAETQWLAQRLTDPQVRIVDLRAEDAYRRGHIPGAVHLSPHQLKDPDNEVYVIAPDRFATLMGDLGIGNDTTVVGYDDQGGLFAARLWWVLDYYGHANAKVLNGGWNKWVKENRPVTTEVPVFGAAPFVANADPRKIGLVDELLTNLKRPDVVILDARSPAEYSGFDVRAKRVGHIPGAVNIEWVRNLTTGAVKTFRPAAELRKLYEAAGVTRDKRSSPIARLGCVRRMPSSPCGSWAMTACATTMARGRSGAIDPTSPSPASAVQGDAMSMVRVRKERA